MPLRATGRCKAPALPRQMQLLQSRGRGGAISQPIDKENDSDKEYGNRCDEKPDCPGPPGGLPGAGFVGFDENPKTSKPPRNDIHYFVHRLLEIADPFFPIAVFFPELRVHSQHFLLVAGEGTAQAIILVPVAVIEHVHVDFPHQAARAPEIHLRFSTLIHVRNRFPLEGLLYSDRIHLGDREPLASVPLS